MKPEKLFHELLGLGMNWEVQECEFDHHEGVVRIKVVETRHLWEMERSPGDGAKVDLYDHTKELVWRHLNVFEHRCEIRCRLPRGKCQKSGKVYRITPPWEGLSIHFTKAFEAFALLLMREMPVSAVSRLVKETDTRLWRMLKAHVAAAHPQSDWSNVVCVGCDEMSVRKGHNYITVFCDMIGKKVLFAVKGKDRGVEDILIAAVDGLKGFPEAITTVFPQAQVQTCIVHLTRYSLSFCGWKDRKAVAQGLQNIYRAESATMGMQRLEEFEQSSLGQKYPMIGESWKRNWEEVIPFFSYPPDIRKMIYTTNAIESLNMQLRKVIKNRGHFPSDEAATKLIYLALRNITKKWKKPPVTWNAAVRQFAIQFGERFTK